jgi:hypothetical protein
MKAKYLYILIFLTALTGSIVSCKDTGVIPVGDVPEISFVFDTLVADMNQATNVPVVAIINSEVGLHSVKMFVDKTNGESVLLKEVISFFNENQYSLTERPNYEENYKIFRVVATDLANKSTTSEVPFRIIGYKNAPIVQFELPEIVIDELRGDPTPRTKFSVTSSTNLKSLLVTRYLKTESPKTVFSEDFIESGKAISTYNFDDSIPYNENDVALQVTAIDTYGKSKIATLPIKYNATPVPTVSALIPTKFLVEMNAQAALSFKAESQAGIKQIRLISMHKNTESGELFTDNYASVKSVNYQKTITFNDDALSAIKIIITDINNKKTEKTIPTIVGLEYVEDQWLGSQFYTRGIPEEPGVYGMYSLKLKRGLSIYEAYSNPANVDFLFYMYDQSKGIAALRFLSPVMTSDAGRYKNGPWYLDLMNNPSIPYFDTWTGLNATKYLQLNSTTQGFTFEDATLNDLNKILKSTVNLERLRGTTVATEKIEPGYVYIFKTGTKSAAGAEKIGLFKVEEVYYVSTMPAVTQPWGADGKISTIGKLRISIKMPK